MSGRVTSDKKLELDPTDAVTQIKTFSVEDCHTMRGPRFKCNTIPYVIEENAVTTIEWQGTFDTNTGRFLSRLPFGISKKLKAGSEEGYMFSLARRSPTVIQMTDQLTKKSIQYPCVEPCVMDSQSLLSKVVSVRKRVSLPLVMADPALPRPPCFVSANTNGLCH